MNAITAEKIAGEALPQTKLRRTCGGELVDGNGAQSTGPEVVQRLLDLPAGVHHESAVEADRFADPNAAENEHVEGVEITGNRVRRPRRDVLTVAEDHQLVVGEFPTAGQFAAGGEGRADSPR